MQIQKDVLMLGFYQPRGSGLDAKNTDCGLDSHGRKQMDCGIRGDIRQLLHVVKILTDCDDTLLYFCRPDGLPAIQGPEAAFNLIQEDGR